MNITIFVNIGKIKIMLLDKQTKNMSLGTDNYFAIGITLPRAVLGPAENNADSPVLSSSSLTASSA